jgi:pilus assembly protein CpaF
MSAVPSSWLEIVVALPNGEVERTPLPYARRTLGIGRHDTNDVRLEGDLVSRHHASVEILGDGIRVSDSSTNGTLVGEALLLGQSGDAPFGTPIGVGEALIWVVRGGFGREPSPQSSTLLPPRPEGSDIRERPPGDSDTPAYGAVPTAGGAYLPVGAVAAAAWIALRRKIHRQLLDNLDLAAIDPAKLEDPSLRPRVLVALRRILSDLAQEIPSEVDPKELIGDLTDEALGLGPLERLLADPSVSEIMVVDSDTIFVERAGKIVRVPQRFTDDERARAVIERIVTPLGRRIDESSPLVDARLKDGSRVNAVIRPVALRGTCITIRKFSKSAITPQRLVELGAMTPQMLRFLLRSVEARKNIVVSGGTGSGKTTLLNALSAAIPADERIVTIEDAAELRLVQPHVVSLETRPPNMEGKGELSMRLLVKNALRMRPDRIMVGECRAGEALDMLQAMNTGHEGSMTTTHANSPREAIARLETLCLMSGLDLPQSAIREQIATSINLVVQVARLSDGTRKVTSITEVTGLEDLDGTVKLSPIFEFARSAGARGGHVEGRFRATGYLPSFLDDFIVRGFVKPGERYL